MSPYFQLCIDYSEEEARESKAAADTLGYPA